MIADAKHADEAKKAGLDIDITDLDTLKKFNKDKKLVKKWAKYMPSFLPQTLCKRGPNCHWSNS